MSIYSEQIDKIYRIAKKFRKITIRSISQVGEMYDPKKFVAINPSKVEQW